jgi:exonuclease III
LGVDGISGKKSIKMATICTFNCEGINRSTHYIQDYLKINTVDFMCLQETWLLEENSYKLGLIDDNYMYTAISGMDSKNAILTGRPFGGVAIIYNKKYAKYVQCIKMISRRLCAIKVCLPSSFTFILVCVYCPCDTYSKYKCNEDYLQLMDKIEEIISGYDCDTCIIAGDFNTCFNRKNAHSLLLTRFIERNNLYVSWNNDKSQKDFTYTNYSLNHKSCIDHCLLTENVYGNLTDNYVVYNPLNPSNHNIVVLKMAMFTADDFIVSHANPNPVIKPSKPKWDLATSSQINMYKDRLDQSLQCINFSSEWNYCTDLHCIKAAHLDSINRTCKIIIDSCLNASSICIPLSRPNVRGVTGWVDSVKYEKDISHNCSGIGFGLKQTNQTVGIYIT